MPVRESIVKDFWLKLFSLALAVLIWATVKFALQNQPPTSVQSQSQPPSTLHSTNPPARD